MRTSFFQLRLLKNGTNTRETGVDEMGLNVEIWSFSNVIPLLRNLNFVFMSRPASFVE